MTERKDLLQWRDDLSVSIPELDEQHKQMIYFINKFHKTRAVEDLEELIKIALQHFEEEEILFKKHSLKYTKTHLKHHDYLVNFIKRKMQKVNEKKESFDDEFTKAIAKWFHDHAYGYDSLYAKAIRV